MRKNIIIFSICVLFCAGVLLGGNTPLFNWPVLFDGITFRISSPISLVASSPASFETLRANTITSSGTSTFNRINLVATSGFGVSSVVPRSYVDGLAEGNLLFYPTANPAQQATGAYSMQDMPLLVENSVTVNTVPNGIALVGSWITDIGLPGISVIHAGIYKGHGYSSKNAARDAWAVIELYIYHANGTRTFVATSTREYINQVKSSWTVTWAIPNSIVISITDRLCCFYYIDRTGSANALSVTTFFGGPSQSYFEVQGGGSVFLRRVEAEELFLKRDVIQERVVLDTATRTVIFSDPYETGDTALLYLNGLMLDYTEFSFINPYVAQLSFIAPSGSKVHKIHLK